jgi:hypothetical protein
MKPRARWQSSLCKDRKEDMRTIRMKSFVFAGAVVGVIGLTAGPAGATHAHYVVREDRNAETNCQYVASGQTEKSPDEGGGHRFHENVHLGQPGSDEKGTDVDKEEVEGDRCDNVYTPGSRRP